MRSATVVAAVINVTVAAASYTLAGRSKCSVEAVPPSSGGSRHRAVYLVIAISGLCALGSEVIWTRLLALMMGATVYTFSIILAVFLTGLGVGSTVGSVIARQSARSALGYCQILA